MKKTIVAITAAAFLGSATIVPTPAAAYMFVLIPAVFAKEYNPKFEASKAKPAKKMKAKKGKKKSRA